MKERYKRKREDDDIGRMSNGIYTQRGYRYLNCIYGKNGMETTSKVNEVVNEN